jgi:transcriptional regulator with XRE-family HTH domain
MADELRELVKARRGELGLSYSSLAAACVGSAPGVTVSTGWLHRLETGAPVIAPSVEILAALATGLQLQPSKVQEAAAAQFFGVQLSWQATGEAADLVAAIAVLPDAQRQAIADLILTLARDR